RTTVYPETGQYADGGSPVTTEPIGLRALLRRAAMSPEQFARKLNRQAALMRLPARVDPKTPYKWLRGALPRPPWPAIASIILSEQLGVPVTPTHIGWPDVGNGTEFVSAASGLEIPWTAAGAVHAAVEVAETNIM